MLSIHRVFNLTQSLDLKYLLSIEIKWLLQCYLNFACVLYLQVWSTVWIAFCVTKARSAHLYVHFIFTHLYLLPNCRNTVPIDWLVHCLCLNAHLLPNESCTCSIVRCKILLELKQNGSTIVLSKSSNLFWSKSIYLPITLDLMWSCASLRTSQSNWTNYAHPSGFWCFG